MITSIEFGAKHGSCRKAREMRKALGPDATQADWWLVCPRGDWMIWQLESIKMEKNNPALDRSIERIAARAIRRGWKSLSGERSAEATAYRSWARHWLDGTDRSVASAVYAAVYSKSTAGYAARTAKYAAVSTAESAKHAKYAAVATAESAARTAKYAAVATAVYTERKLQARDIRREIPEWPGE